MTWHASPEIPTYEVTERGFKRYKPVATDYGHEIFVYESSAASGPRVWLSIEPTERSTELGVSPQGPAHLTPEQARVLIATLQAALANHYQGPA